jgi:stage III sporulation protein AC
VRSASASRSVLLYFCGKNEVEKLDIGLILKVAGVGILVSAAAQILQKSGRDEQSTLVVIAGIIVVLIMLVGEIEKLFQLVMNVFGF